MGNGEGSERGSEIVIEDHLEMHRHIAAVFRDMAKVLSELQQSIETLRGDIVFLSQRIDRIEQRERDERRSRPDLGR